MRLKAGADVDVGEFVLGITLKFIVAVTYLDYYNAASPGKKGPKGPLFPAMLTMPSGSSVSSRPRGP